MIVGLKSPKKGLLSSRMCLDLLQVILWKINQRKRPAACRRCELRSKVRKQPARFTLCPSWHVLQSLYLIASDLSMLTMNCKIFQFSWSALRSWWRGFLFGNWFRSPNRRCNDFSLMVRIVNLSRLQTFFLKDLTQVLIPKETLLPPLTDKQSTGIAQRFGQLPCLAEAQAVAGIAPVIDRFDKRPATDLKSEYVLEVVISPAHLLHSSRFWPS